MRTPSRKEDGEKGFFGKFLSTQRVERKISLRNLSKRVGISPSYLSKIENNLSPPPSIPIIKKMAVFLKVNEDDLLIRAGHLPDDLINNNSILIYSEILKALKGQDKKALQLISDLIRTITQHYTAGHKEE